MFFFPNIDPRIIKTSVADENWMTGFGLVDVSEERGKITRKR